MYELQVEKMTCGGCAARVTRAVQTVDDGAKVEIDLRSKTVRVESDVELETVASAIVQAGYPVSAAAPR
jgi:copper chaperone